MAFTTVFFGLVIPFVSNFRGHSIRPPPEPDSLRYPTKHWILGARGIVLAALYRPPGVSMEDYLSFPYDTCEIIRRDIFRFSIVVGDFVMVRSPGFLLLVRPALLMI